MSLRITAYVIFCTQVLYQSIKYTVQTCVNGTSLYQSSQFPWKYTWFRRGDAIPFSCILEGKNVNLSLVYASYIRKDPHIFCASKNVLDALDPAQQFHMGRRIFAMGVQLSHLLLPSTAQNALQNAALGVGQVTPTRTALWKAAEGRRENCPPPMKWNLFTEKHAALDSNQYTWFNPEHTPTF